MNNFGKRFKQTSKIKNVIKFLILVFIIINGYIIIDRFIYENKITEIDEPQVVSTPEIVKEPVITKVTLEKLVDDEYLGYKVAGFLEIPAIKLETNVLLNYSEKGLAKCVSKFWGTDANEIGNFCIAGHHYKKPNMFNNVYKLQQGDKIFLSDNINGKFEYEIYSIHKVKPENTDCLSQNTNGKREITLITCNSDAKYRIIVKAREI